MTVKNCVFPADCIKKIHYFPFFYGADIYSLNRLENGDGHGKKNMLGFFCYP
jgi:hypothetical protein